MRLVADNCPSCGARIQVDADATEASCTYCSATFRVADRAVADRAVAAARARVAEAQAQSRVKRGMKGWWLVPLALVIIAVLGATFGGGKKSAAPEPASVAAPEAPPPPPRASWLSHQQALLTDVNGDGLKDPIGWVRYYRKEGTPQHLAALDAKTGEQLWESDAVSDDGWINIRIAFVGDHLVVADNTGLVRALSTKTGKAAWSTPVGERVRRICRQTDAGVLLYLDDDRALEVALATGSVTPRGKLENRKDTECETLASLQIGENPTVYVTSPMSMVGARLRIDGLDTSRIVLPSASPLAFALGTRTPGTRVPTVAAFAPPASFPARGTVFEIPVAAVWKVAISGASPDAADEQPPENAWYDGERLYVHYTPSKKPAVEHLVALDAPTGRVVYDVPLAAVEGGRLDGLIGEAGRLYATHSKGLEVYDAKTGAPIAHLSD